jgi:hypothetical protein
MKIVGLIFGILASVGLLLGFIPFLGWLNWFNIPFAVLGLIISLITKSGSGRILCLLALVLGIIRLMLGGGLV